MHKEVQTNKGNWFGIPMRAGDHIIIRRNEDEMLEFVNPYDDAELSCYLKRMTKEVTFK